MVMRLNRIDQHQYRNKSTALPATPTTNQPISLPVHPANQLPIYPDGWRQYARFGSYDVCTCILHPDWTRLMNENNSDGNYVSS